MDQNTARKVRCGSRIRLKADGTEVQIGQIESVDLNDGTPPVILFRVFHPTRGFIMVHPDDTDPVPRGLTG